jgi:RND family efflux transporter MFP subunit
MSEQISGHLSDHTPDHSVDHTAGQANKGVKLTATIAAVAAVVLVGLGIASRVHSKNELTTWTQQQAVPSVVVIHPAASDASNVLTLPANLEAFNNAAIYARTSGYVQKWLVDIGDTVRSGQLLAILDAPDVEQQIVAARADLQTALANEQLSKATADRWANLVTQGLVSKQENDEKQGDLAAKSAVSNAARANVAQLQALKDFTHLTAPFDGVVTSRSAQIGALVNAGSSAAVPLFTIADVSHMRAYVRVPQIYSTQLHDGLTVQLELPEFPGRTFPATVTRSAGAIDPASGTLLVELQAANAEHALKPGAYAQANLQLNGVNNVVTLPASAIITGKNGTQVALIGADNKAELRDVTLGRDHGKVIDVIAGLKASDAVIDSPPDSLQSGDQVQPIKNEANKPAAAT